ncbi:MAG TPA: hypothetical protein VL282_17950 [Tepidisphaeraceae bacterium]|jgi:hypothetical protein|nr:hypothetical protein [Tepidisphaeraceae bacterium]
MSSSPFQVLDIQSAVAALEQLHGQVVRHSGRIEIKCSSGNVCVLISKTELESLEQAIEILSQGSDYKQMCDEISDVAISVGGQPSIATHSISQLPAPDR